MATVQYNSVSEVFDMVNWTGSNLDEIVAFVGAAEVRYDNGVLTIRGEVMEVNDRVAKMNAGGTLVGRVRGAHIGVKYTAV